LDIIQRLRSDLGLYLKEHSDKSLPADQQLLITAFESSYQAKLKLYEDAKESLNKLQDKLQQHDAEISITEGILDERGGSWASSRQEEKVKANQLLADKKSLSDQIREMLSGIAPLTLAKKALSAVLEQLKAEQDIKQQQLLKTVLDQQLAQFTQALKAQLGASQSDAIDIAVQKTFATTLSKNPGIEVLHDISDTEFNRIQHVIETLIPQQEQLLKEKIEQLNAVEDKLSLASTNIDRAPDAVSLKEELELLAEQTREKAYLEQQIEQQRDTTKRYLRESIDVLRKMRKQTEAYSHSINTNQASQLAANSRQLLVEFADRTTKAKVQQLEQEFVRAFQKLARKDDISLAAKIDPKTFNVELTDTHGQRINKQQLSAGEKQIYAIAMLEALGRTSGRNLPVIIDTPLGRLDSKHRNKLVDNYFPTASHQVIILSTDTEVDEHFFTSLQPQISHAYEICYDSGHRCSSLREGYFWKQSMKEAS
ncbi:MAG: DNA sulfur modification protein DndD, partial [Motiliproteus sp.]